MSGTAEKLADELPGLDKQNGATLGRILGRGSIGHAEEGSGGKMPGGRRRCSSTARAITGMGRGRGTTRAAR
jgi:hypothetical protein